MKKLFVMLLTAFLIMGLFSCDQDGLVDDAFGIRITFNANGGEGVMAAQKISGKSGTLNVNTFTKTGYDFSQWNTKADGTGTAYADGSEIESKSNITLYAQWAANSYTVTFNSNGGEGTTMESMDFTYDEEKNLTENSFTREEFIFSGWNTASDGTGTSYADKASVKNLTATNGATVTLYAQWGQPTVTFYANNGTATSKTQSVGYNTATALNENTFARTGYTFSGWNTSDNGDGTGYSNNESVTLEEDLSLYAQWTANTYTVTFSANGGDSESMADQGFNYDEEKNLTANAFTRTGYHFNGWNTASDGSGTSYTDEESVSNLTATNEGTVTLYAQWATDTYILTFNSNGGSGNMDSMTFTYNVAQNLSENEYTRSGYYFTGWNTSSDGNGTEYSDQAETTITEDTTLYAQWGQPTVTFYANNGTNESATQSVSYGIATQLNANSFTKTGYTFNGWNTTSDGTGDNHGNQANVTLIEDLTLYAQWVANTYTVAFDANGGEGSLTSMSFTYDVAQTLTANTFTRTGYHFNGWNTANDGNGTSYTDAQEAKNITATNGATVTLYAQWEANAYTVVFNANGGSGSMNSMSFTYGVAQNLTANSFARTGYHFTGWNTASDGSGTSYTDAQNVSNLTETNGVMVTLYAQWAVNTYTVAFDANGGNGSVASMSFTYGEAQNLTANAYTRTGYEYSGWNTVSDGSGTSYTDAQSVSNLTETNGATVTLFAKWTANPYTVAFDSNGGSSGTMENQSFKYDEAQNLTSNAFAKAGYHFVGWKTSAEATEIAHTDGEEVINLTAVKDGTVTLYAQWEANTYTVAFNANGGSGSMDSMSFTYGETKALTTNAFTRTGYHFAGWNTASDGSGTSYTDVQSVNNLTEVNDATVTLYAQWEANSYTVAFNANGGSGSMDSMSFTYGETKALAANAFANKLFDSWNTESDGSGTKYSDGQSVSNLTAENNGTVTLYAQWRDPVITFYANDGTNESATQSVSYGIATQLNANSFTKTGYTFNGWNTTSDGTGDNHDNQANVTLTEDLTLYAQWTANTYTVVFNSNEGNGTMESMSFTYDVAQTLTANTFTRTGYHFNGWNTANDGNGTSYTDAQNVSNLTETNGAMVTLYAQWEANAYTVVFHANGGTGSMNTMSFTYGVAQNLTANAFTKTGYHFNGWNTANDGNGTSYTDAQNVSNLTETNGAMVTLYAQWEANTYTVAFNSNNGEGTMESMSFTYDVAQTLTANSFTRTDYHFNGWNTANDGNGTSYEDAQEAKNITATNGATVTLYAQWYQPTVTFYANGGTPTSATQSVAYNTATALNENSFARTGYTFSGWNTSANGNGDAFGDKETVTRTEDLKLYAQWTANTYTVAFDANGGEGSLDSMSFTYDVAQTLTANTFSRTGYIFTGWNTANDGSGTSYTDAQNVSNLTETNGVTVTLYAQWYQPTVTFYANGGTPTSATQSVAYNTATALNENSIARTGYTFSGWNTSANGNGDAFGDKETVTRTEDLKLYAQWTANTYTVVFDSNGGAGEMESQSFTYNVTQALTANTFENTFFDSWNTESDGSGTKYSDGQSVRNLTAENNGTVTLYAQWRNPIVTFYANDGTNTKTTQSVSYNSATVLDTNNFARAGYSYSGLNTYSDGTGTAYEAGVSSVTLTEDMSLYAQWTPYTYTVVFDANEAHGGSGTMDSQSFTYGVSQSLTISEFTYNGTDNYEFLGWSTSENGNAEYGDGAKVSNLTDVDEGTVTLYAVWGDAVDLYLYPFTTWTTVYTLSADTTINGRVTVSANAKLILPEGKTLTIPKGITVAEGCTFTIVGTGTLEISSPDDYCAGIGASETAHGGDIIINGGIINVTGGQFSAGIGGAYEKSVGNITINGGEIVATGGEEGAGIGSGNGSSVSTIVINGGNITAKCGADDGAGIGSSYRGSVESIVINAGTVTAEGGAYASGIGTGYASRVANISIKGGVVNATGKHLGAGIGKGYGSDSAVDNILIEGGKVTATGGEDAAGIGGGYAYNGIDVSITGGAVYAIGNGGYGIGRGDGGNSDGTLTLGEGISLLVSGNGTSWSDYDGTSRAKYMKTSNYDTYSY